MLTPAGERVLSAASELFYREGLNAVGVAAVAEAAGVTKKTLYACFGSKTELTVAYLRRRHDVWWAYLEERLAEAGRPRALVVFDAYVDHPKLGSDRGCAFLNAAAELPAGHPGLDVIRRHKAAVRAKFADLLREDAPAAADPERLAEQLFLLLEGAVAHTGIDGDAHRVTLAREIAEILVRDTRGAGAR
ncbi:TetR/AcrR family transcriptional regulator [Amycolatopsis sp. NPDC057786]|uniref:TetR/AcrR family transcriptional regulator n=1 Tax=Amycolatopsis sp. NPDC057786 TaxID=3346250 RepID=UPI00366EAE4E